MLRFGIIGTNFISDRFAEAAASFPDVQISAVYSRTPQSGQAFADKYQIPYIETDFQKFCASEAFDCAYVASPNFCHADQAIALLNCHKHVLCEKPIAVDLTSFLRMKEAAIRSQCILMEAMRSAYDPAYAVLRRELPRIGKLRRACLEFCQYSSRYDRFKSGEILNAFNPALGNAAIMDIGVYCIYLMIDLFGSPSDVHSSSVLLPNGMEGMGTILMDYPDMIGEIAYSKITDTVLPSIFQGEEGSITFSPLEQPQQITWYPRKGEPVILYHAEKANNMEHELHAFKALIQTMDISHRSLHISEETIKVLDRVREQNHIVFS